MKALSAALALVVTAALSAQEPEFEIASVKPTTSPGGTWAFFPGEARFEGHALDLIIPAAFDVPMQVASLKIAWTTAAETMRRSPRFQIFAKGDRNADSKAMLRTLLKERFGLRTHTEIRQVPVYALTVKEPGRLGRWLKSSQVNCQEHFRQLARDAGGTRAPQCFSALNEQRFGVRLSGGRGRSMSS
jgi:uncharacterized protein (TIGR03435 family)